jgi:NAD(P)-dependent dehydrogenase (short-subunit alcohol dehydrogenase family)
VDLGLVDKTALITGASKGIGLAVAHKFAAEGCNLQLNARSKTDLEAARSDIISKHNVSVTIHPVDISSPESVHALAAECAGTDILINNAGAVPTGPIEEATDDKWREGFDLKIFGTVNLTRDIYLQMKARGDGVIINVIGNCGERPDPEIIIATIANSGLMGFTKALGGTSVKHGVRVVGINPGPTATERLVLLMKKKAKDRLGDEDRWRELTEPLPMGRTGTPEEIADLTVFAASPRASYISGTIMTADGGVAAQGHIF